MADAGLQSQADPYGDTLETLWERSKKKLPFLNNDSKEPHDSIDVDDSGDKAKTAHARRRDQVRRAQRNHRERKEKYIKSLEQELLRLRDERESVSNDTNRLTSENSILREIMLAHGILMPQTRPRDRLATVTVVGEPGFGQRLQVSIGDGPEKIPPVYPEGFGVTLTRKVFNKAARFFSSSAPANEFSIDDEPRPEEFNSELQIRPKNDPNGQESQQYVPPQPHPYHFDATQVAVDFVLFLERCCLRHRVLGRQGFSGHALTLQAPLLLGSPPVLYHQSTWEIPASELERLFELAGALNLDGEITPVQAWRLISDHPKFYKLDPQGLQRISEDLVKNIQCFGFGAILDEKTAINIVEQVYASL
ncbi:uncharacterized protein GIQ15_02529 [Arthroderma uncinatum]|uniref:uncharacterized protein n=1 Tax=Arthroderma uncinatum TaxID=74035 RepID=UPI00144AFA15|nr:uncharacterized protein GIQ15_02529 [Arthroderma uncinatum]KAF3483205.1 hypothetical protein GIQ15_02529 [Arthroderma uncinatum]